ncbi:uncharacterized protein DNG_01215 [Cephalotrichum gorgonifer]|uniref:Uncharacterized protein n=1 Tax=Cephalotrichum gorgonifer TaxID=2041049 RepID=A0AAE8MSL7_9PEZI|nr:uncharacterized protein DNG_01215 [Cephalotrichum gorgonifer]
MSLLTRLQTTEAIKDNDTSDTQAPRSPGEEKLDPRTRMMKEIQAMLDEYSISGSADDNTLTTRDSPDNLSLKLKNDFVTWGGIQYATSVDNLVSASHALAQRVETMTVNEQRIVDEVTAAHEDFAYPLGASLVQQERSGVPTGEATTLDEAAASFRQRLVEADKELECLWGDWSRSLDKGARIPDEFARFVQGELESFRKTCDADLEKMEGLEQEFKEQLQGQLSDYLKCLIADL